MAAFLLPLLAGAALGGGGGSSSSSTSQSVNTIGFTPTINIGGDIRDTQANTATDAAARATAVSDNQPSSALDGALLQPQTGGGIYGDLNASEAAGGIPAWMIAAGGVAILGVGYFLTKG